MNIVDQVVALHRAFDENDIPHALGGALALAYWTENPRGTDDIDFNVFVPVADARRALDALPTGVHIEEDTQARIARDGQIRLWWNDRPVDLFFDYESLHARAASNVRTVPFSGTTIPVLGAVELAAFKALFDRSQDWVDIESMLSAGTLPIGELRRVLTELLGPDDPRFARLDAAQDEASRLR